MSPRSQVSESPTDEVRVKTASRLSLSKAAKSCMLSLFRGFSEAYFSGPIFVQRPLKCEESTSLGVSLNFFTGYQVTLIFDSSFYHK